MLHDGLAMCAQRSCYAYTWILYYGGPFNICFVFTMPLILGFHNRSQLDITFTLEARHTKYKSTKILYDTMRSKVRLLDL